MQHYRRYQDVMSAPEVLGGQGLLGLSAQAIVDFLQALDRQAATGLAVGAIGVGRQGTAGILTESLSLADRLTAGSAGLGDLP